MLARRHPIIPCISSIKLLPNVADLLMTDETYSWHTFRLRRNYTLIVSLLFYPYITKDDIELEGSYWKRYVNAIEEKKISPMCLQVLQNIQDVYYNCSKLKSAREELEFSTEYESHESDQREQKNTVELNTVTINEM